MNNDKVSQPPNQPKRKASFLPRINHGGIQRPHLVIIRSSGTSMIFSSPWLSISQLEAVSKGQRSSFVPSAVP